MSYVKVEEGISILDTSAVQFCARKVSAMAGDMRKALDIAWSRGFSWSLQHLGNKRTCRHQES